MPGAEPAEPREPGRAAPESKAAAIARAIGRAVAGHPNDPHAPGDGLQRIGGPPSAPPVPTPAPPLPPVRAVEAPPDIANGADAAVPPPVQVQSEAGLAATGISGLDAQFGGGLPNGSLFLLTSQPTTATGIFAAQYAGAGLSAGETVYYVSLEQAEPDVRAMIARFVQDPKDLERLHIVDGFPTQFRDLPADVRRRLGLAHGDETLDVLEELITDTSTVAPVRIIIESLTELYERYDHGRVLRVLRSLRALVHALPATAVVTMVEPLHDARTVSLCKHLADGVIEFHVERKGFGIYPYISITKMRGVMGSARLLLFKETDSGLWLESTKRVY